MRRLTAEERADMRTIIITRKKRFANAVMPYWIIIGVRKANFCKEQNISGDLCEQSDSGFPIPRIDSSVLDRIGIRIGTGETVEREISDDLKSFFVSTIDGCLSEEVILSEKADGAESYTIDTKGGFRTLPHPVILPQKD